MRHLKRLYQQLERNPQRRQSESVGHSGCDTLRIYQQKSRSHRNRKGLHCSGTDRSQMGSLSKTHNLRDFLVRRKNVNL